MTHCARHWLIVALITISVAMPQLIAAAQPSTEATPGPAARTRPVCGVRPWTPAELVMIMREPVVDDPVVDDLQGDPLPPAARGDIGNVVAAWSACLASGNVPGLLSLFTADGVRRLLDERTPFLGGPAGLRVSILAVSDVVRLPDGRVGARVTLDPSGAGTAPPTTLNLIIEQVAANQWRIDHLREANAPATATASASAPQDAPGRPLLRRPITPGSGVALHPPGVMIPMRGVDLGRGGVEPGSAPTGAPAELWRTPTGWHSDVQPIVARGLVYFGGFSLGERVPQLVAVDQATGGVRWQTTAPVAWAEFPDAPALAAETLFAPVQAPVAGILAVAAGSGEPLWFMPFGFTSLTAPAVDGQWLYVSGWSVRNPRDRSANDAIGAVFALDQRTGREIWRFLTPARFETVAVGPSAVYVPSERGLFALDRSTGAKRWQARFSPGAGESPVVAGDLVVFAGWEITSGDRGVFALDAGSGALKWRRPLSAAPNARATAAASGDALYVTYWESAAEDTGIGSPVLTALDLATGEELWTFRATGAETSDAAIGTGWVTPPVIVAETAVFGVAVRESVPGAPTVNGLYAVDARTGGRIWYAATDPIRSAPSILDGVIYAMGGLRARGGASGGNLYAFAAG